MQKPHPPISLVAVSSETLMFAAEKGYSAIIGAITSLPELEDKVESYWKIFRENGHNGSSAGVTINRFIYVSDTNEKARRDIEGPFMDFIKNRAPDLKAVLIWKYGGEENFNFDRFINDFCLFGSPETVISRITGLADKVNLSSLLCSLNFITLDHALSIKSMELFAKDVIPNLHHR